MSSITDDFYIPVNDRQTPITAEFLRTMPDEVIDQFLDYIQNVPFIQNLITPDRPKAKDLHKDEDGKIIVDITKPHILEDMDYFRSAALHYEQHNCYTFLIPNKNPNSEYYRWFQEEKRRCREGYVRESDGEWVTGDMYWFLNYSPILLSKIKKGTKKADRVRDFPRVFEGIYWRSHYLQQARNEGKHAAELARRGAGKSFFLASKMAKNLILGESSEATRDVVTILTAYQKEYLADKDGTLSKFVPMIDFVSEHTEFPRLRLRNSSQEMFWQMGYMDSYGRKKGSLNSVMGVSSKDDVDKLRGKRGFIYFEEFGNFPGLLDIYNTVRSGLEDGEYAFGQAYLIGCVCAGTKVWTSSGKNINIENITKEQGIVGYSKEIIIDDTTNICNGITKEPITDIIVPARKECLRITLSNGNFLECSIDHPILFDKIQSHRLESYKISNKRERSHTTYFKRADELKVGDRICECRKINIFGNDTLFDSRLIGMLIGDGSYGVNNTPKFSSEDGELLGYIKNKYAWGLSATHLTKKNKVYEDIRIKGLIPKLKEAGIYGQVKTHKRLPVNYETLTEEDTRQLLSGLYDTDGTIYFKGTSSILGITQCNKEILEQIKLLWRKFGVIGSITKTLPTIRQGRKDKKEWYNFVISGRENLTNAYKTLDLLVPHKKETLSRINDYFMSHTSKTPPKTNPDYLVYKIVKIENIGRQTVYNLTAGLSHTYLANNIITHNTANNKESNFESAKSLLYEPDTHRILSVNNVYDKVKQGRPKFAYFFPAFINREGCYDDNGNSDVVAALKEILMYRYDAKYSSNPNVILSRIAEYPITPSEAIIKVKNAYFPVSSLSERLQQLDTDPKAFDDIYVGKLVQNKNGIVEFVTSGDIPIRKYGVENSTTGAIEIYEMPQKNHEGEVFPNRYIVGHDPVDNDQADSSSLSSTFVLDLFTDRIVAEYTGRQPFADDNFEIVRLLCLYYRATCMYESHPYSQEVIMADGTKRTWKDVNIGDSLNTIQGKTKVVNIPFDGEADVYKVTLEDGRIIYAGENHTWDVVKLNLPNKWVNISTKQMMDYGVKDKYNRHNFFVPNAGIVDYKHEDVPIDPYTFGLLLAEGAFTKFRKNKIRHRKRRTIQISSSVNDMDFYKTVIPYPVKYIGNKGCSWYVYIDDIDILLCNLGLLHHRSEDKFIPDIYKYNDYNTRMEMLKGLMDGDGCASTNGARVFVTSSVKLKDDIMSLCRSLGMNCSFKVCVTPNLPSYRISIYTESNIFKLPRKIQNAHIYDEKARGSKASSFIHKTAVKSIEFSHKEKSKCITVDRHDGLYMVGDYVLTHNCNKKGLYAYFEKMRCTRLLALTPQYLRDKQLIKYSAFGSNAYGINATAAINNYANDRINEWLKKPITTIKHVDGEDITVTMPQLYTIRSRALLEELIAFDTVRNFDRIRSLGMAMLYREEKVILYCGKIDGTTTELGSSSLADDDFFNRNYNFRNI